ncbi:hypothetical protein Btru_061702 [Bulinus truncatus]|nr:hypothetical protein Btru_061702 [Bulinus truncatus]
MEDRDFQYKARGLREVFKGRFTQEEINRVLEEFDGDQIQALDFLLKEDPEQVSGFLKKNTQYIQNVQADSQDLLEFLENSEIVINPSERQFACMTCNRSWWKKVPFRKEVSRCKVCLVRYDAIPKNREWGIGIFRCPNGNCGKEFRGWAIMGMTQSRCYGCQTPAPVSRILSPKKSERTWKTKDTHQCNGINCYNGNNFARGVTHTLTTGDNVPICAHPKSRHLIPPGSTFLIWSLRHASSGSTVSTFLDQGSLSSLSGVVAASRPTPPTHRRRPPSPPPPPPQHHPEMRWVFWEQQR